MTRNLFTNKLLVGIVTITMLTFILPSAAADAHGHFGTQVMQDDDDFRPQLDLGTGEGVPDQLCHIPLAGSGISDDAFYLTATGTVSTFDIRLTSHDGNPAGSLVMDSDTSELDRSCSDGAGTADPAQLLHIDVSNSGTYNEGDYVYITTDATAGLDRSQSDHITIRLTSTANNDAGTLVRSSHDDFQAYQGDGDDISADYAFRGFDATASGTFEQGDWVYVTSTDSALDLVLTRLFDIRIVHENQEFGSQVLHDDPDFVPTLTDDGLAVQLCQVDRGSGLQDDSFYLNIDGSADVTRNDVRLTGFGDHEAGSLVRDIHDDAGLTCSNDSTWFFEWIDADDDGDFTDADWVYLGTEDARVSGSSTEYWIRLTDTDNHDAGTLVFSSDDDIRNFGSQMFDMDDDTTRDDVSFAYFDVENTGSWELEDWLYVQFDTADPVGEVPDMFSLRLVHESEEFGSFVTLGDDDFVPTLTAAGSAQICMADLGDQFHEDGYYLDFAGDDVDRNDLRLVPWGENEAGTLLSATDTTELSATTNCQAFDLVWIDTDDDGIFTDADYLYIANTDEVTASGESTWVIRLTSTDQHDQGTLVRSGNNDLVTYGSGNHFGTGNIAFFDSDNSGDFRAGNWAYASPDLDGNTDRLGEGDIPNLYDVRLTGAFEIVDDDPDDDEGPTVTITAPGDGDEFDIGADVEITGTAEAGDNDIDNVTVTANGEELDVEGTEDWSATLEGIEAGDHTIEATATDTEGNTGTDSVTITVAEEMPDEPEISITSPSDGTEIQPGEEVTIEGTASGEDVEVTVTAGDEDLDVSGTEDWSATWMASEDAGSFVITATVTDSADQTATDTVTVSVAEETTDDDEVDDQVDDEVDDETTDDEVETPGFSALAALIATVAMAALLRRN